MHAKRLFIRDGQSNVVPLQSAISGLLGNAEGLGIARSQGLYRIFKRVQYYLEYRLDATISSESNLNPLNILNPMPLFRSTPSSHPGFAPNSSLILHRNHHPYDSEP
jgi:hypothetical protein